MVVEILGMILGELGRFVGRLEALGRGLWGHRPCGLWKEAWDHWEAATRARGGLGAPGKSLEMDR